MILRRLQQNATCSSLTGKLTFLPIALPRLAKNFAQAEFVEIEFVQISLGYGVHRRNLSMGEALRFEVKMGGMTVLNCFRYGMCNSCRTNQSKLSKKSNHESALEY